MIEVEERLSRPFVTTVFLERGRVELLKKLVNSELVAVQTRDALLRVINGDLSAIFGRLYSQKKYLQVLICEKRRAIDIDSDVGWTDRDFLGSLERLSAFGVIPQHLLLLRDAFESENPIQRVAARCAIVLLAAYIELDGGT